MTLSLGSLFAGIGGFDLAAAWLGWRTAWFSEIDPYASRVLAHHWPGVPNHGDITQLHGSDLEPVDLLCGGFPCQDISLAGKGHGLNAPRSGLWWHFARLIGELRPRWVVAENVDALRTRGLVDVLRSLAQIRYDAEWHCISAAAVGAPHRRDRIWIVAYPERDGLQGRESIIAPINCGRRSSDARGPAVAHAASPRRDRRTGQEELICGPSPLSARPDGRGAMVADAARFVLHRTGTARSLRGTEPADSGAMGDTNSPPENPYAASRGSRSPTSEPSWWAVEPNVGRVAHGVPARVDRLRCLGNAIVPEVAFRIFQAIQAAEELT